MLYRDTGHLYKGTAKQQKVKRSNEGPISPNTSIEQGPRYVNRHWPRYDEGRNYIWLTVSGIFYDSILHAC